MNKMRKFFLYSIDSITELEKINFKQFGLFLYSIGIFSFIYNPKYESNLSESETKLEFRFCEKENSTKEPKRKKNNEFETIVIKKKEKEV